MEIESDLKNKKKMEMAFDRLENNILQPTKATCKSTTSKQITK
jgi:hypothetical protein